MLGEESHQATLDSSAGDNRIVCAVIYTAWHWEVSSTLKGLGSRALGCCLPHGNPTPMVPPWQLWGPHYLGSIQLEIIKNSSKHTPEGIGHFINKWRSEETICSVNGFNCKMLLRSFLAFFLPILCLGAARHSALRDQKKQGGVISPLLNSSWSRGSKVIRNHIPPLGENASKGGRGFKSMWAPALPVGQPPSVTPIPCMQ